MICIFCEEENNAKSVEHIVSESLGNKLYVMQKGEVCDTCNGKFSKFEGTALANSIYIMERGRFAIRTKKGNNAKGRINELTISGDEDFRPGYINIEGLTESNFKDFDPTTNIGKVTVASFDKSEVATSKLVLKIGLESMYKSQRHIYNKFDFKDLRSYLVGKTNINWPFLTSDVEIKKFESVPRQTDKYRLKLNHCELKFLEIDNKNLLFKFKYGSVPITINLINQNLDWIIETLKHDEHYNLYPIHFRNKIDKK